MQKLLLAFVVFLSIMFVAQVRVYGCTCVSLDIPLSREVSGRLKDSTAVFSGEAIKLEKIPGTRDLIATFSVDESWKGDIASMIEVRTAMDGASCGYDFRIGTSYLVYAFQQPDALRTSLCGGNRPRYDQYAEDQIKLLGKGKTPKKST
jgi:hypothetical protein